MTPILLLALALSGARETFVYDEADILGPDAVRLEATLREYEHSTTYEVVVLTTSSLNGLTIENYTSMRWGQLGVGKLATNNGVMLVLAPNERKIRVQRGSGLSNILTQSASDGIMQAMIPSMKAGNYSQACWAGIGAIKNQLTGQPVRPVILESSSVMRRTVRSDDSGSSHMWFWILLVIVLIAVMVYYFMQDSSKSRRRYGSGSHGHSSDYTSGYSTENHNTTSHHHHHYDSSPSIDTYHHHHYDSSPSTDYTSSVSSSTDYSSSNTSSDPGPSGGSSDGGGGSSNY